MNFTTVGQDIQAHSAAAHGFELWRKPASDAVTKPEAGAALQRLNHRLATVPREHLIYDEHDRPDAFYRMVKGCVRLQVICKEGYRQILAFCLPGDMFGIRPWGVHVTAAETVETTVLQRFSMNALTDGQLDQASLVDLVGMLAEKNSALLSHLRGLNHISAEGRLMRFLDWLASRQRVAHKGGVICLPMSRRDIADFIGLSQETVSRSFARLRTRGHIQVLSSKQLLLRPLRALARDAEEMRSTAARTDPTARFLRVLTPAPRPLLCD